MRRRALTSAAALALFAGAAACGGGGITNTKDAATDGDRADSPASSDAASVGDSASTDAADGATHVDAGPEFTFVDVADTTCQNLAPDAGVVVVQGPGAPRFVDLGVVSTRRFAGSEDSLAIFDTTGQNATAPFAPASIDFTTSSSEGTNVAVASLNFNQVGFTRYNSSGGVVLATVNVETNMPTGDSALAMASKPNASLLVWRQGTGLRGLEYTTSASAPVDFGLGTFASGLNIAVANGGSDYGVVWTALSADGTWRLRFAPWGNTNNVTVSYHQSAPMQVARLVPAASGSGWAALVNSEAPQEAVLLVPLDLSGHVSGAIRRYLGTQYAWSVASSSGGYAMVARRATNEPEWRSLTTSGDGNSPWICLAGSLGNQIGGCGVDSDNAQWAAVFSTPNGGDSFVRLDSNGTPQ